MARYDYGLRGPRETIRGRGLTWRRSPYDMPYTRGVRFRPPNRVTAPYNMDYLRERGPVYPRNPNPYGGEWEGQIGGEETYAPPYLTHGGTRTDRGVVPPVRRYYRNYGPDYGGRYPDEI